MEQTATATPESQNRLILERTYRIFAPSTVCVSIILLSTLTLYAQISGHSKMSQTEPIPLTSPLTPKHILLLPQVSKSNSLPVKPLELSFTPRLCHAHLPVQLHFKYTS